MKASNPNMGVCEVSAAIGQLWRGLGPEEKQRHNNDYTLDKVSVVKLLSSSTAVCVCIVLYYFSLALNCSC